jgi:signal transduction histidine kinase/ligand-binding sensor domain-containing protein/DNA-binding response OmpR family regulator
MKKHSIQLLLLLLIAPVWHISANEAPGFERFLYNEKLPSNSVNRIYHDSKGYMWFGTRDGLSRFDGYDIKVFRSSPQTPGKMTSNEIEYITEDNRNRIWVGTSEGVNIIDNASFNIHTLDNPYTNKERIYCILMDDEGMMWIATSNFGVLRMNPETEEYIRYSADPNSPLQLPGNTASHLYKDQEGNIWLSFWNNGLCMITPNADKIFYAPRIGSNNNPFRVMQDSRGEYWVLTWGDGMFQLTINQNNDIRVSKTTFSSKSTETINDISYSITEDINDRLWVVTYSGLRSIERQGNEFVVTGSRQLFGSGDYQLFHTIVRDRNDNLWLGSVGEGVFQMDYNRLPVQNFPLTDVRRYNAEPYITRFVETNYNELFIVVNRVGLFHFNMENGTVTRPTNPELRNYGSIFAIANHSKTGTVWLAGEGNNYFEVFTTTGNGQLRHRSTHFLNDSNNAHPITDFHEDATGTMWIGTTNGIFASDAQGNTTMISDQLRIVNDIKHDRLGRIWIGTEKDGLFYLEPNMSLPSGWGINRIALNIGNYESLSVQSLLCMKNGLVYIATKEGGIYVYNPDTNAAQEISNTYGISEEGLLDIIDDNQGNIWLTTLKRIIRYNPKSHASIYYSTADGIDISAFFKNALIKLKSGEILFGGNNGFFAINPDLQAINTSRSAVKVKISDIMIQNKSLFDMTAGGHFDPHNNSILLKHNESSIGIEFSSPDYYTARKIQYAYRMSGIDKDWNYVGNNRRFVNYVNLIPGTYLFEVRSSDENGVWSDEVTSLRIRVQPPWYASWWAYLLYVITTIALVYLVTHNIANRIRLRNELKISLIDKEKTEELTQIKLRYFTNISHELLTPLTIIMLQIESLQKQLSGYSVQFDIMKENVVRLKRLIKQILVFRKTETGNMKLKVVQSDIVAFVRNICQSNFQPQVEEKQIQFSVDIEYDNYLAYFDPDKLDKVVYNILSNAFKFTPQGGSIAVKASFVPRKEDIIMRLSVSDTGQGIPESDIPHIFRRFYISSTSDQSQSHGIGLSLTQELLQIHHGKIEVNSVLGEGTVFTIEIPVNEGAYTSEEKAADDELTDDKPTGQEENEPTIQEDSSDQKKLNILVVEDNKELNQLIADHFTQNYTVYRAENGLQALQIVHENEIDLIISDVMMPEMNGLTFCKIIKNDVNTSHINVLMLTAKNTAEDRIECYNAGADAFIAKPFEVGVLNARVKNLIGKRRQKVESFQHGQEINISSMEYNSIDEIFLKQAVEVVENKLADERFDFDQFADDMATSKSTLHRKLKSLTGLSPGEFIRNIRMKHSLQMLRNNIGNISEIAYSVGFSDPKYFSRCFKNEFGHTPKEWIEMNKRKQVIE